MSATLWYFEPYVGQIQRFVEARNDQPGRRERGDLFVASCPINGDDYILLHNLLRQGFLEAYRVSR